VNEIGKLRRPGFTRLSSASCERHEIARDAVDEAGPQEEATSMSLVDLAERRDPAKAAPAAEAAREALAHERAGRFREAWEAWEALRDAHPARSEWNAPLAASYLRYAFAWTADGEGSLEEAEVALIRGMSILTIDLADRTDDVARLMLIARACEQRCILRAFGGAWTTSARDALDAGAPPAVTGEARQVVAAGLAATTALDLVAISAPSLASIAAELAQSCLRLATVLRAAGAEDEALGLEIRAEAVLRGPRRPRSRPELVAIPGGAPEEDLPPPRRPALRLVTSPTA
jgi:hypothetical protein